MRPWLDLASKAKHHFELLAWRSGCEGEAVTKAGAGEGGVTCPRYRPPSHLSPPSGSSAKANVMRWLEREVLCVPTRPRGSSLLPHV